jgi:hypothetical protein
MASLYVLCLAGLVLLAFYLGRSRAYAAAAQSAALHSRPSQHGLLLASMVLLIMLGMFVLGWALTGWIAEQRALWEGRLDRLETYLATLKDKEKDDG